MTTWSEVEQGFRDVKNDLQFSRLDRHWGDAMPERWDLIRTHNTSSVRRFEAIAILAGKLLTTLDAGMVPSEVRAVEDPLTRWYIALWMLGGPHQTPMIASVSQTTRAGVKEDLGHVFVGSINDPAAASAGLALLCQAHTFVPEIATALAQRGTLVSWLENERKVRGPLWALVGVVLGLTLAALALL